MSRRGSIDSDQKTAEEVALLKRGHELDDSSTRLRDDDTYDEHDPLNIDPDYVDISERTKERQRGGRFVVIALSLPADSNAFLRGSRFAVIRKFILPRKKYCVALTAIVAIILAVISIGGALLHRSQAVPETRRSPPWYPTRTCKYFGQPQ